MADKAEFVDLVTLHSGESLAVYRAPCGGVFGIDSTYVEQVASESTDAVFEPFSGKSILLSEGLVERNIV